MKMTQKDSEKFMWDHHQMRSQSGGVGSAQSKGSRRQLMVWLTFFVTATYVIYTLKLLTYSRTCDDGVFTHHHNKLAILLRPKNQTGELDKSDDATYSNDISYSRSHNDNTGTSVVDVKSEKLDPHARTETRTNLEHIVFGIASSAQLWNMRKSYIKLWWKPERKMRGVVWLDSPVKTYKNETNMLPELKISQNTSEFLNKKLKGHPSAIRISRIVSETLRLGMENVRWFVMGDDDTVFFTENLVRVLNKYDHNQFYYIGSSSESHLQNIFFSYSMAYGGGGFAISYPLAKALGKMQDRCIKRYPTLFASDDRMQACMAELGVPLTKHLGFHQFDVHGNVFGLLAAHPVTPLVSLHHLDVVEPIFPNVTRVEALQRLTIPMKLDSAGLMQQSVCYVKAKKWTVSVSWGFAVQIYRGVLSPREIEMPSRTFLNWYKRADYTAYAFNTRPVMRNPCQKPYVFYMSGARMDNSKNQTVSQYTHHRVPQPECRWKIKGPDEVDMVEVYKKPDPHLWDRSPRRNCCRILNSNRKRMVVDVGICREDEVSEM